ncbi:uncharacterized protein ACRADG_005225 isoform 1-T3 [Cochliomyia hominivorax]
MPRQARRSLSPLEERDSRRKSRPPHKTKKCCLCHHYHTLRKCLKFKRLNVTEKLKIVKKNHYCENCLAYSHLINRCRNTDRCRQCGGRHHSLLHRHERLRSPRLVTVPTTSDERTITLLPTIVVKIELGTQWSNVRGILNPCSEVSSIAEFLVKRYKLSEMRVGVERWCKIKIRPRFDENPIFAIKVKIEKDLPRKQPKEQLDDRVADLYANLHLADPTFYQPSEINIILGADIFPRLIKSGLQHETVGSPMAQDTVLGWTIIGLTYIFLY